MPAGFLTKNQFLKVIHTRLNNLKDSYKSYYN